MFILPLYTHAASGNQKILCGLFMFALVASGPRSAVYNFCREGDYESVARSLPTDRISYTHRETLSAPLEWFGLSNLFITFPPFLCVAITGDFSFFFCNALASK